MEHMVISKKHGLRLAALPLAFALVCTSACSGGTSQTNDSSGGSNSAASENRQTDQTAANTAPDIDITAKYDPPVAMTTVRNVNPAIGYVDGETIDDNIWYDAYASELGITLTNIWSTPSGQYRDRANLAISTGDIPDFMEVNPQQLKLLVELDLIMDLTELYETYSTELTRQIISSDGGIGLQAATYDGKLMAIPDPAKPLDSAKLLWIRKDWLTRLGLAEPQSMEDLIAVAEAFVKDDPDGNGADDTLGFVFNKDMFSNGVTDGFFNSFHAYPNIWIEKDGKLEYGSIQPEMKTALAKLNELYEAGLVDQEFGVKDLAKMNEAIIAGKAGMYFGGHGNIFSPFQQAFQEDETADWTAYPLLSVDDNPAKTTMASTVGTLFVVNKHAEHPEAVIKLLNFNTYKQYGADGRDLIMHNNNAATPGRYAQAAVRVNDARQNIGIYHGVQLGLEQGHEEGVNFDARNNLQNIQKYLDNGDPVFWATYKWSGPGGALSVVDIYDREQRYVLNAFYGPSTDTMQANGTTLDKIMAETFLRIITGDEPIEAFDNFVDNWKTLGGNDIAGEVNEWFEAQK